MNLLNKLTIKNLRLNKKRTIVTIIGIMLSVALITAVASIYSSGISSLIKFEIYERGDFHVAFYDVPTSEITTFKNNREIKNLYVTQNIGYAKLENSQNEYKPYAYIKSFTKEALENLSVKLVEGRLPENNTEIVIPTHLKTNGRITFNVGDSITLDVGTRVTDDGVTLTQNNPYNLYEYKDVNENPDTEEILNVENGSKSNEKIINTTSTTYKIVGIIERPANNIESYDAPGYTFITYNDESKLSGDVDIYAKYTKNGTKNNVKVTSNILGVSEETFAKLSSSKLTEEEHENVMKEMNKAKYQYNENTYLIRLETNPLGEEAVGGLGIVVMIVCGIIVFTSVFCIKNSFDISITEKIKQYGMLRSIGATKKQIKRNVFYEATILGLIGIPLGILAGFSASYILIIISNYLLTGMITDTNLKLYFSFSWFAILVAILLGIATIYLSAIRSARKASKISPIDSIRNSANIKIKSSKIKRSKIIYKLFGIGGDISYKNLKRNKKKYRTTVISIVVSVFVFIALYSFMSSAFNYIENELNISDYNIYVSMNIKDDTYNQVLEATKLDNIEDYTILREETINSKNIKYNTEYKEKANIVDDEYDDYISIVSIGDEQYKKYIKSLGLNYEDMKNKAIIYDTVNVNASEAGKSINYKLREYAYEKGDVIEGTFANEESIKLSVGYIAKEPPFGMGNIYYGVVIVSDDMYDTYFENNHVTIYYKSSNADKLQDDLDILLNDSDYYIHNIEEMVTMMNNLYTLIGIFLYGFIIVISLIGITNIFNTITTNMELRKQEFAMLESIGMTKKEFNRMIRLESIFMGVKSLFFGIPIGVGFSYLIYYYLVREAGTVYSLPIVAIAISVLAVFLLISCIMKYSMGKINRQNTIETIRNENI